MKKILVVLTNFNKYGETDQATGLWLGEATEFVNAVTGAGYDVDYVSPKGGFVPLDPRSMKNLDHDTMTLYSDPHFIDAALTNSLKPADIDASDYEAIYYTGGHGVMWDFPNNKELQQISLDIYKNGGYVTSVCHGIAGLLNIKDDDGKYLISGKNITGFTTQEEFLSGKRKVVPFLNENAAKALGANFKKVRAFKPYAVQDGQLITGQNHWSPKEVARLLLQNIGEN